MALFGEILSETKDSIRLRVATQMGDAPEFGIQGVHEIAQADCFEIRRRCPKSDPPRAYDELEVSSAALDRLARRSFPV